MSDTTHIDEDFKKRLPPLTDDERTKLKESIEKEGEVRDPIIVWKEENIIVDGHHRFEIYHESTASIKALKWKLMSFPSREAAMQWMDDNARGQRSLTDDWRDILIGREYNATKQTHGGQLPKKGSPQVGDSLSDPEKTVDKLAKKHNVSKNSIERKGEKAFVYDKLAATQGVEEAEKIKTAPQKFITTMKQVLQLDTSDDKAVGAHLTKKFKEFQKKFSDKHTNADWIEFMDASIKAGIQKETVRKKLAGYKLRKSTGKGEFVWITKPEKESIDRQKINAKKAKVAEFAELLNDPDTKHEVWQLFQKDCNKIPEWTPQLAAGLLSDIRNDMQTLMQNYNHAAWLRGLPQDELSSLRTFLTQNLRVVTEFHNSLLPKVEKCLQQTKEQ